MEEKQKRGRQKKDALTEAVAEGFKRALDDSEPERHPGVIIGMSKVPWTKADVERTFPPVTFTPEENIPIVYQGVRYDLYADKEITVPSIIKEIYDEHRRLERVRSKGVVTPLGEFVPVSGVGGLPPEL